MFLTYKLFLVVAWVVLFCVNNGYSEGKTFFNFNLIAQHFIDSTTICTRLLSVTPICRWLNSLTVVFTYVRKQCILNGHGSFLGLNDGKRIIHSCTRSSLVLVDHFSHISIYFRNLFYISIGQFLIFLSVFAGNSQF
jgi:hypothetical protein